MKITESEVLKLNEQQKNFNYHPYTCCSPKEYQTECYRRNNIGNSFEEREGILIATSEYWICPCGKYKQQYK